MIDSNTKEVNTKWLKITKRPREAGKKTDHWYVFTADGIQVLGLIKWYGAWRQYAFFPEGATLYEKQCLRDIADFLEELNRLQLESRQNPNMGFKLFGFSPQGRVDELAKNWNDFECKQNTPLNLRMLQAIEEEIHKVCDEYKLPLPLLKKYDI